MSSLHQHSKGQDPGLWAAGSATVRGWPCMKERRALTKQEMWSKFSLLGGPRENLLSFEGVVALLWVIDQCVAG